MRCSRCVAGRPYGQAYAGQYRLSASQCKRSSSRCVQERSFNFYLTLAVDPATGKDIEKDGQEGEMWLKGPSEQLTLAYTTKLIACTVVMKGYHKRPDATAEAIVEDGWFRTGDVAYIKNDFWFISDRMCVTLILLYC